MTTPAAVIRLYLTIELGFGTAERIRSRAPLSSISAPTLFIHGTADPMFPVEHGQALAQEIPDPRLLKLDGAGHGIDPVDQETIEAAIIDHTASADHAG